MSETPDKCERDVREDFVERWAVASPYRTAENARRYGAYPVPCDCGEPDCCGWRMDFDPRKMEAEMLDAAGLAVVEFFLHHRWFGHLRAVEGEAP